jgi:hypothetical protein
VKSFQRGHAEGCLDDDDDDDVGAGGEKQGSGAMYGIQGP